MSCELQASGAIELYFYGELDAAERAVVRQHLPACAECRQSLAELSVIRDALASRPEVSAPAGGDWSGFMARLDAAVSLGAGLGAEARSARAAEPGGRGLSSHRMAFAGYLAMAALLALVTISVLFVARTRPAGGGDGSVVAEGSSVAPVHLTPAIEPGLVTVGQEHLERSKLVVLGMAAKDAQGADWDYERELAQSLLNDTKLYRITAEQRGMSDLAGVLRDLEIVLLQTALTEQADGDALAQIQRLIRKRDLVGKMDLVKTAGS